jgi:hypothetical protein
MQSAPYTLFLDDTRHPDVVEPAVGFVCWSRDLDQAQFYVTQHGMPSLLVLDPDLGAAGDPLDFLRWLHSVWPDDPPCYRLLPSGSKKNSQVETFIREWVAETTHRKKQRAQRPRKESSSSRAR